MTADYWDGLSEGMRNKLSEIAWRYLRLRSVPDRETALELLAWQQLDVEVTDAYGQWLTEVKSWVEAAGLAWTHANMLLYCQLREHE